MEMPHRIAPPPISTLMTSTADLLMLSQAENYHTNISPSTDAYLDMDDNEGWATPHETMPDAVESHRRVNYKVWWETERCFQNRIRALEGDVDVLKAEIDRARGEIDTAKCQAAAAEKQKDAAEKQKDTAVEESSTAITEKVIATNKMEIYRNRVKRAIEEKEIAIKEKEIAIIEKITAIDERNAAIDERDAATKEKDKAISKRNTAVSSMNKLKDMNKTLYSQMCFATSQSTWYKAKASTLRKEGNKAIKKINEVIDQKIDAAINAKIGADINENHTTIYEGLENQLARVRDILASRNDELTVMKQAQLDLEAENNRLREYIRSLDDPPNALHRRDSQQSQTPSIHDLSAAKNNEAFDKGRSIRREGSRRRKTRRRYE